MKSLLFLAVLMITGNSIAQTIDRVEIQGRIVVPEEDSAEGITIFNSTANLGTISTEGGEFSILAGVGDSLVFSAVQYQDFTVVVDEGAVKNQTLQVVISEAVNPLPVVVVTPYDLSGNVRVDVNWIEVVEPNLPEVQASEIQYYEVDYKPDAMTLPKNAAMDTPRLRYGLNFVNIFKAIFSERGSETADEKLIDEKIRSLYDDKFFKYYLDIEYENINDFIFYAENHGLTPMLLKDGNELDLIEFLIEQARDYKKTQ